MNISFCKWQIQECRPNIVLFVFQGAAISLAFRLVRRLKRPAETVVPVQDHEPVAKKAKTDEQVPDICNDTEEANGRATNHEIPSASPLREDDVSEEPDVDRPEEETNTQTDAEVSDVDVGKELIPEAPISEQDSGIFEPTGDEKSLCSEDESRDEEMADVSKPDRKEKIASPSRPTTEAVTTDTKQEEDDDINQQENNAILQQIDLNRQQSNVKQVEDDIGQQETNAILQEIDLNRKQNNVDREQPKTTAQEPVNPYREEPEYTPKETNVSEKEKDVSQSESRDNPKDMSVPQPENVNSRKSSINLERMFDTDVKEPTSPQIVVPQPEEVNTRKPSTHLERVFDPVDKEPISPRIVVPQPEGANTRKTSVHLERMFDPDDEEPTSPQIVEDIIASLDAEDAEDSFSSTTALTPGPIPLGSPIPVGLTPHPVTVSIPRPGGHRLVNPISPLARVPITNQVSTPTKVIASGDDNRIPVDPMQSMGPANVRLRSGASGLGAMVTDPDVLNEVGSARCADGAEGNAKKEVSSGEERKAKMAKTDNVRHKIPTKATCEDRLLRKVEKKADNWSLPSAVEKSSCETPSLSPKILPDEVKRSSSSALVTPNPTMVTPFKVTTSDTEKAPATADPKTASKAKTTSREMLKSVKDQRSLDSEATRPSVIDTSVTTGKLHELGRKNVSSRANGGPEEMVRENISLTTNGRHNSKKEDSCVSVTRSRSKPTDTDKEGASVSDERNATTTQMSDAKPIAARSPTLTKEANIGTVDSPKPASTVNGASQITIGRGESLANRVQPKSREKPESIDMPSIPVMGPGTLAATGAAMRGISAIATGAREGEVVIERVPNVFMHASNAEKACRPSAPEVDVSNARSKVDCSVQTMPAAKTNVDNAKAPKSVAHVSPKMVDTGTAMAEAAKASVDNAKIPKSVAPISQKMVDTGTATAEFVPAKRPASVPHRSPREGRDHASSGRRVSASDSHLRRPTVGDVHMETPPIADIHTGKSFSGELQRQSSYVGEPPRRKPSADDVSAKFRRPSVEAPGPGKQLFGDSYSKLFNTVPRPADIPLSPEALRHMTPDEMHPFSRLTSGTPKPYSSGVLKVPQVSSRTLLNNTYAKSPSKDKQRKSSRPEHEKKPSVSYSLWKNMKAAKVAADGTKPTGPPEPPLKKPDPTPSVNTPLDLTTHVRKTVAADSTSMLAKTPSPPPKPKPAKPKQAKAQGTQTIHSIVSSLANRQHISLTPITSMAGSSHKPKSRSRAPTPRPPSPYLSSHLPMPMPMPMPEYSFAPGGLFTPSLHVNTSMASRLGYDNASMASRLSYDMAMRNLLTLSHMAMAQGGMVRPQHMFPMQPHMFPPRPKSHDFHPIPDPSLLRQQSEARMGAASKKASPTAGTTAPQLRTPTGLTSASIQQMEDLTRTVGKKTEKERHSVAVTSIPSG